MAFLLSFKADLLLEREASEKSGAWGTPQVAVPIFWGTEGEKKELKGWSDKRAEAEMGLGEEKQNRLAQSFQGDSELLRGALQPAKNWRRKET